MQINYLKPNLSFALEMKTYVFVVSVMDLAKTQMIQGSSTDLNYWAWPVWNSLLWWNWSQIHPQFAGIPPSSPSNFLLLQSLLHRLSPPMPAFPALRWCQVTGRSETGAPSTWLWLWDSGFTWWQSSGGWRIQVWLAPFFLLMAPLPPAYCYLLLS